jgi:hypothetical protein
MKGEDGWMLYNALAPDGANPTKRKINEEAEYRNYLEIKALQGCIQYLLTKVSDDEERLWIRKLVDHITEKDPRGERDYEYKGWRDR